MRTLLTALGLTLLGGVQLARLRRGRRGDRLPPRRHRLRRPLERRRQGRRLRLQERPRADVAAPEYKLSRPAEEGLARHGGVEGSVPGGRRQGGDGLGRHLLADLRGLAQQPLAGPQHPLAAREVRRRVQQRAGLRDLSRRSSTARARRPSGTRTTAVPARPRSGRSRTSRAAAAMHDGIDNDGDGKIDEYGSDGIDGIQGWWGTCHAWTPASQLVPEPQHAVTLNGVNLRGRRHQGDHPERVRLDQRRHARRPLQLEGDHARRPRFGERRLRATSTRARSTS